MPMDVIYQIQIVIRILRRESERIVLAEVVRRHGRVLACRRDRAKGGVFVVSRDSVRLLEEDELRDVLVAVVGVEEVVLSVFLEDKRACRHRLRRIPAEDEVDCVVRQGV